MTSTQVQHVHSGALQVCTLWISMFGMCMVSSWHYTSRVSLQYRHEQMDKSSKYRAYTEYKSILSSALLEHKHKPVQCLN